MIVMILQRMLEVSEEVCHDGRESKSHKGIGHFNDVGGIELDEENTCLKKETDNNDPSMQKDMHIHHKKQHH
ncbi:hypothetical protein Tco_0516254 [Tanacetum coccineum]